MKTNARMARSMLCLSVCTLLGAADIVAEGVLGNSGGQGATLVRGGVEPARSLGPAVDRWGCLWDRAGKGVVIRCTADGRMLASYRIPDREHHYSDRCVIAGDRLVMLLRNELWSIALDAAPGSEAAPLKQQADALAPNPWKGRALVGDGKGLAWVDPVSGERTAAGPGFKDLMDLDVGPDGTIYAMSEWKLHALRDGKEPDGWPKGAPGEKPQLVDGFWYGHGWHSTVKRHDLSLAPAPGVVLGGNSGSFIGHVDENPDIVNGRGLRHLDDGDWAIGHFMGGISLMSWDGAKRQFSVTRRIDSLSQVRALAVDGQGRVTLGYGWWAWNDSPDTPLHEGPGVADGGLFQLAPLGEGRFASFGLQYGNQPRLASGTPQGWRFTASQDQGLMVAKETTGVAAVRNKNGFTLIAVTADGKPSACQVDREGRFQAKLDPPALAVKDPQPKAWTSLAVDPQGNLLAAADGSILVLAPAGNGWSETRRWNSWGEGKADSFGDAVWIQTDGARLWAADRGRHRVLCFDLGSGKPIASFGAVDQRGDDLAHLDAPQMIAANGDRCVVHDAGNQRLVRLSLR